MRTSRPSSSSVRSALAQVWRACPYCWLKVVMDGVGIPGARVPSAICRRSSAARRTYALGSDSSLIDTLVPYSIGNIANRNASTLVEIRRGDQWWVNVGKCKGRHGRAKRDPGQVMVFYSWIALSGSNRTAVRESDWLALRESGQMVSSGGRSGTAGSPVAMGITDDRGRAMKAG